MDILSDGFQAILDGLGIPLRSDATALNKSIRLSKMDNIKSSCASSVITNADLKSRLTVDRNIHHDSRIVYISVDLARF